MNIKEIEKIVGSLQRHLFRNSNSISVGMLKSHFKGAGLQFKEHQIYTPGDDVRFIDWKVSAKTNTTVVKTFEEERNVEIYCFLDITPTMFMGYKNVSKLQAAIEIICLLFILAEKTKDKVSVILGLDGIQILPLVMGQEGIVLLISQLEKKGILKNDGKINTAYQFDKDYYKKVEASEKKKLSTIKSFIARNKELVLLSDFSEIKNHETLNKLIYRPNMHCFQMVSPIDEAESLPFSVFGWKQNKKGFVKTFAHTGKELDKGRFKKIHVKGRYLEDFVREML